MHGKRPLYPHAKRQLAYRERAARALPLDLEHDALEDLGAPPGSLDHLEMDLHPVANAKLGYLPQLTALDTLDQLVHR